MFKEPELKETHDEFIDEMALQCLINYVAKLKKEEGEQDEQ